MVYILRLKVGWYWYWELVRLYKMFDQIGKVWGLMVLVQISSGYSSYNEVVFIIV